MKSLYPSKNSAYHYKGGVKHGNIMKRKELKKYFREDEKNFIFEE